MISYYNDSPSEPDKVALADKLKQGITNLGFLFTTNGSKKVDLSTAAKGKTNLKQRNARISNDRISTASVSDISEKEIEAFIFSEKFF